MKVLYTSHVANPDAPVVQQIFETDFETVEEFFCSENQLEFPFVPDKWTTINEHGVYLTFLPECVESWTRIG